MSGREFVYKDLEYAHILDQMDVAVIVTDKDGRMVNINQSAQRMFGYLSSQMLEHNVSLLMPPIHASQHSGYIKQHLDTGVSTVVGCGRRLQGRKSDGTVFPVHVSLGRHEQGDAVMFIGIVHDLSDLEEYRNQALRFGQIVEESVNEIYVFKHDTLEFTHVNRGSLTNLGYHLSEMKKMTPLDVKKRFTESSFRALIAPLVNGEVDRVSFQSTHTRKDGSQYDIDVVLYLSTVVSPAEIISVILDCTQRNRLLEAVQVSQKMESVGQLTGGIAHDFNNLLTVIAGNLELLETSQNNEEKLDLINEARQAAARGAQITARLLSFSMQKSLEPKLLNVNDIVLDLSDLLTRSAGSCIVVSLVLSPNMWLVKADQSQLDSALLNLTINARDAMPDGGTLTIATRNRAVSASEAERLKLPAGDYAELSVADSGTGIEAEHLHKVFEPFFSTKPKHLGSGLGLSMVYGFARQSGGGLWVDSKHGEGSVFTLLLPRDCAQVAEDTREKTHSSKNSQDICVLLVEDEESVRKLTARRLLSLGYKVIEASNALEAMDIFSNTLEIGLILTDMVMPGEMSGQDLYRKIRKINEKLPIIITSGFSVELNHMENSDDASVLMLHKPYTLDELDSCVSDALSAGF